MKKTPQQAAHEAAERVPPFRVSVLEGEVQRIQALGESRKRAAALALLEHAKRIATAADEEQLVAILGELSWLAREAERAAYAEGQVLRA